MMRMARPAHPGPFIRMEVIDPLGLSVTKAAEVLGVTRPALSSLLNGHAALSPEMALRIEKAFGPKMDKDGHPSSDANRLRNRRSPRQGRGHQG